MGGDTLTVDVEEGGGSIIRGFVGVVVVVEFIIGGGKVVVCLVGEIDWHIFFFQRGGGIFN